MATTEELIQEIEPTIEAAYEKHKQVHEGEPLRPDSILRRAAGVNTDNVAVMADALNASVGEHILLWEERGINVRPIIAAGMLINILTEDNLEHYAHETLSGTFGSQPLRDWVGVWISQEREHGTTMRDWAVWSNVIGRNGLITPDDYYAGRANQAREGINVTIETPAQGFAYLSLQELATYEAHRNLAWTLDRSGKVMLNPISGDEINHFEFYRKLEESLLDVDPDFTVQEIRRVFETFNMPGEKGIPTWDRDAITIATSGVFDLKTVHDLQVKLIDLWDIENRTFTDPEAKAAQAWLIELRDGSKGDELNALMEDVRVASIERARATGDLLPFIFDHTVELEYSSGSVPRPIGVKAKT